MSKTARRRFNKKMQRILRSQSRVMRSVLIILFDAITDAIVIAYRDEVKKGLADDIIRAVAQMIRTSLTALFHEQIVTLLATTWPAFNKALNESNPFDVADPAVIVVLARSGQRITGITNTIRNEIQKVLIAIADEGLDTDMAAERIRKHMTERYRNQSYTIARTELGFAHANASYQRYHRAGITHVEIMDNGKDDPDAQCALLNGTIQTLDWYNLHPLEHPNCTRAAAPVVD